MPIINTRKGQQKRYMDERSRISMAKATINRTIKQYEILRDKSRQDAIIALKEKNERRTKVFASFIAALNKSIDGLKDFTLFLELVDIGLREKNTEINFARNVKNNAKIIKDSQLTPDEISKMNIGISSIIEAQQRIDSSLNNEFEYMGAAVDNNYEHDEKASDEALKKLKENTKEKSEDQEANKAIDKLVDNYQKVGENDDQKLGEK